MAKMVGLSRNLKEPWLNKVAELAIEGLPQEEVKTQLNDYLGYEIESPTNLRKTREILMNVWIYDNDYSEKLFSEAKKLYRNYPDYSLEIHWCLLLAAYPVFGDVCKLIGKMSQFQDEITLVQIKQKLFDEWGERTTLYHSMDKLIATMKALGVISGDKGKYRINKFQIKNQKIVMFMVYTMMCIDNSGYYTFLDLSSSPLFFPFEFTPDKADMMEDDRFIFSNFGGESTIGIKE